MDFTGFNIVIVGDTHVAEKFLFNAPNIFYKPKSVDIIARPFMNLENSIQLANDFLKYHPETDLLLLFPFLWEFLDQEQYKENWTRKTCALHLKENVRDFFPEVKDTTNLWQWQFPNMTVCWFIPYTPDFVAFKRTHWEGKYSNITPNEIESTHNLTQQFHRRIKNVAACWLKELPSILSIDLHQCYFLHEPHLEELFFENSYSRNNIPPCTTNGLIPSIEFIQRFFAVFQQKIYPILRGPKQKTHFSSEEEANSNLDRPISFLSHSENSRSHDDFHHSNSQSSMASEITDSRHYNDESSLQRNPVLSIDYKHSRSIDYQHAGKSIDPNFKPKYPQYDSSPSFNVNKFNSDPVEERHSHGQYRNPEGPTSRSHRPVNPEHLPPFNSHRPGSQEHLPPFNSHRPGNQEGASPSNHYQRKNETDQHHRPPFHHNNIKGMVGNTHPQSNTPGYQGTGSSLGLTEFFKSQGNYVEEKKSASLQALPNNLLNTIKDALNFLNANEAQKSGQNVKPSVNVEEEQKPLIKAVPSPYRSLLESFFHPTLWSDLFLTGKEETALDILLQCVHASIRVPPKSGFKVLMVTSSQKLIQSAERHLTDLVDRGLVGINDNIPYGSSIILVDVPSNLRMRLSQNKFESLSQLSAVLVFGDALLANKTPSNMEFVYLIRYILSKKRADLINKVVISESGSTEAEIVAQNAFNTTFLVPKKEPAEAKIQNGASSGKSSRPPLESDKKDTNKSPPSKNGQQSSPQKTYRKQNYRPTVLTHIQRNPFLRAPHTRSFEEKSHRPPAPPSTQKKSSRPASPSPSPLKKSSPSPLKKSSSSPTPLKKSSPEKVEPLPTAKLDLVFKLASAKMSDKEERDYDDHDREFMIFLEPLGRTFEHEYMRIGRAALLNHDSEYKTYAEVPDLHPEYEEKYALFIERFEEVFGKECNPMHLQTTWRHFWELMLTNLKEKDWKEKKKKFQDKFREKYRERHDRLLADREALRVKKEASRKRSEKRSMEEKKAKEEKKTSNEEIIFVKDVKVKRSSPETRKERETDSDRAKKSKTEPDPATSSKPNPLAHRGTDLKQKKESPLQSSPKKVRGREELEKIYIETCSQISREAEKTSAPMLIDDTASSACEKHLKFPTKQADGSKPKIVFNLGVSKKASTLEPEYSLKEALHFLKLVCSKIGMMGHALESIVDKASSLMPNEYKAYLVFSEDDSELLVNICITKIKALLSSSSEAEAKIYRTTISLTQRLLQEYKKAKLNPLLEDSSNVACRVDLMAIAKATTGMDTESTFKFIRNTFLYKGLSEPSKSELDHVFKEVSAIHFKMAFG